MDDVTKQGALSGGDELAGSAIAEQADARHSRRPGRADNVPAGIIMMVLATVVFAGASAASKWLVAEYPVGEVLCLRSLSSLIGGADGDPAGERTFSLCHAAAARSSLARPVANDLAVGVAPRLQPDAACGSGRDQFFRAVVCRGGVDRLAQGAGRLRPRHRADRRLSRRSDRDRSRRQYTDARRAVRAHQCRALRHRDGRRARHDAHGIAEYARHVDADGARLLSQLPVVVRLAHAVAARRLCCCSAPASSMRSGNGCGPNRCSSRRRRR